MTLWSRGLARSRHKLKISTNTIRMVNTKLAGWWHTISSYMIFQSSGFLRSCDKLNTSYLHLHYCHQTWQGCDLLWQPSTNNFTKPCKHGSCESREKSIFYLHYHNAYGHLTRLSGDLTRGAPIHKLAWLLSEAVLWGQVTN